MEKSSFDHIFIIASLVCLTCTAHVLSLSRSRTVTIMPRAGSVIVASTLPDLQRPSVMAATPTDRAGFGRKSTLSPTEGLNPPVEDFDENLLSGNCFENERSYSCLSFCAREIPSTFLEH